MAEPWLNIIGIGEDGVDGLSSTARELVKDAEVIVGGDRHHNLIVNSSARRIAWPSPFDAMINELRSHKGRRLVVLVTGDPLWYSVGARILKSIPREEVCFFPQLSAFQLAACRMGWSLADCETVTIHGRADSQILPHLAPNVRLLVLTQDKTSPANVAQMLNERGFGASKMSALAAMGGNREARFDGVAHAWSHNVPDFHVLAIECVASQTAQWYSRVGGLPDAAFIHDGQITKQAIRSITIAALSPYPDALLWDVGAGCGSVAVEWMRAARGTRACAVEHNKERCEMIRKNSMRLGVEKLHLVEGKAADSLKDLEAPDAVFIGGGLTGEGVFETCWKRLKPGGRLVANAVTLESEARLYELHNQFGGQLTKLSVQQAEPVGKFHGWRPSMPVTQWQVTKT